MLLIIYNTSAGNGNVEKIIQKLCDDLIHSGTPFTTIKISQFTAEIAGELLQPGHTKRVIICGGDGTVNRAINELDEFLTKIEIGIIPCGYGNLIASSLDSSISVDAFVSENSNHDINEIKIGQANNQYFLNVVSIGLTADTVSLVEKFRHTNIGSYLYRKLGGLIIHVLFFCITLVTKKSSEYPSSKAWIRTNHDTSDNSFFEYSELRDLISQYKSLYISGEPLIHLTNNTPVLSNGDIIEHKKPFSWQIDGEPQEKTRFLKINLSCQKLKISTIHQDLA